MRGQHDKKGAAPIPMRARPRSHPIPPPAPRSGPISIRKFCIFLCPVRRHRYKIFATLQISHYSACGICPNEFTHFTSNDSRQHARQWRAYSRRLVRRCALPASKMVVQAGANDVAFKMRRGLPIQARRSKGFSLACRWPMSRMGH